MDVGCAFDPVKYSTRAKIYTDTSFYAQLVESRGAPLRLVLALSGARDAQTPTTSSDFASPLSHGLRMGASFFTSGEKSHKPSTVR